jgi:hypothetical protein
VNLTVKVSGPFFAKGPAVVVASLHDAIQETVLEGEKHAVGMAQPRGSASATAVFHSRSYAAAHGYKQTGHYARSINGRMTGTLNGEVTDSGVVYGPWLEGVSSRNDATRFKGYGIFRRTRDKLQGMAQAIVDKHVKRAMGKIN